MLSEFFPCGRKIEHKVMWLGSILLATSADIAAINPHDAEYTAVPGAGVLAAGLIARGIKAYKERFSYDYDPDDPEREEIVPTAEIVEFPKPPELWAHDKKVA